MDPPLFAYLFYETHSGSDIAKFSVSHDAHVQITIMFLEEGVS